MKLRYLALFALLLFFLTLPVVAGDINSSVRVGAGETVTDDLSTLNGGIRIGDGATVDGDAESVNGGVEIGRNARVKTVSSVNGGIEIGDGTMIDGDVESVNGSISMGMRSSADSVGTVNGSLDLTGVEVAHDVSTYNGDVTLSDGTSVGGDLIIKDTNSRSSDRRRAVRIYVESGSTVMGDVIVEDKDREVEVYLRGGTIAGEILGAKVVEK
ncbi:MAG: hypothetical protein OEV00_02785 [Acidobacteriota bacterium]|nr:hypothetical protein [Acidobacteriota bacterium]MDH3784236.1 hypothetical protein [Acidobacteriota bacterium]